MKLRRSRITIINIGGGDSASYGQNAYFYDSAEGVLSSIILLLAEFGEKNERHIVSVFKLIQELIEKSAPKNSKDKYAMYFAKLMDKLPSDHKAKWLAGAALNTADQAMLSVMSTALSRLNNFLDSEMEQLLCFGTAIDAEKFCSEKSAIFIVLPEEDQSKYFMVSLLVQQLYREITIMFEKENIDTANINDELMITIMGGLAQEESTSISQNLKWSIRRKMKNGTYSPVNAPLGYRLKNKTLVIEESEVKIVKDIFKQYVSGCGIKGTADYINNKYGDTVKITYSSMRYILRNEKYIGDSLMQKFYTPDIIGAGCVPNKGEKDMYYIKNTHQPIISREIFETAQALMKDRLITKNDPVIYPFTRKLECALCGNHFYRKVCRDKYYWVCNKHDYSASLCSSKKITEESIINAFIKLFNKIYSNYTELLLPIQKSLQELTIKQTTGRSDIIEIRRSLLQLKEQLNVIASLRTKGFLNEAKYKEQSAEINNKIAKLNKNLRLLSQSEETTLKDMDMLIDYFEKRSNLMIEFEPQAFEFLIDKIIVKDSILEFHIMGGLIFT